EQAGERFIVMEYVHGTSVRALISAVRRPISVDVAAHIAVEALKGLAYLHRFKTPDGAHAKLIHRHISPQNLLVSLKGEVKIADFGVAKASHGNWRKHTVGSPFIGNPEYAAEELTAQDPRVVPDQRVDLYSLGVVLYEMLTRVNPFGGSSSVQAFVHQQE